MNKDAAGNYLMYGDVVLAVVPKYHFLAKAIVINMTAKSTRVRFIRPPNVNYECQRFADQLCLIEKSYKPVKDILEEIK